MNKDIYFASLEEKLRLINTKNKNKNKIFVKTTIRQNKLNSVGKHLLKTEACQLKDQNIANELKSKPSANSYTRKNSLTKSGVKFQTQQNIRSIHSYLSIYQHGSTTNRISIHDKLKSKLKQQNNDDLVSDTKTSSNSSNDKKPYEIQYVDTTKAWEALKNDNFNVEPELVTLKSIDYVDCLQSGRSTPTHNIPYVNNEKIENDTICAICKELHNEVTYPCRICTKVFHVKCLEAKGYLKTDLDKDLVLQAFSNIGWSCMKCADLSTLLPMNELVELMEQYEFSDSNNDRGISLDEFIRIRKDEFYKRFGSQISNEDIEAAKLRFRLIDTDKSDYIDWVEYMNYECMRRLCKRSSKELVLELTQKEIQRARETFYSFDRDKGGTISEEEARRSLRHWYGVILLKLGDISDIDSHVKIQSGLIMEAAKKKGGEVCWDEYIEHQAIYILANRPNSPMGLIDANDKEANLRQSRKFSITSNQNSKKLQKRNQSRKD